MKKLLTICSILMMVTAIFTSCTQETDNVSSSEINYTAKFDYNIPYGSQATYNGSAYNPALHNIPDITKTKDSVISLPPGFIKYSLSGDEYSFECWNTKNDGSGTDYNGGSSYTLNGNITFYTKYKKTTETSDTDILDICTQTTYAMKVGDTVKLKASWSDACRYEISSDEYEAISLSPDDIITAKAIGTAVVRITSLENAAKSGTCIITVTSDAFSGSGLDYKLLGTWKDGNDCIELYANKSGYIKCMSGGAVTLEAVFNWTTRAENNGAIKYFTISNGPSYLNNTYTIVSVSSTTLKLKGRLAFGKPLETEWTRE